MKIAKRMSTGNSSKSLREARGKVWPLGQLRVKEINEEIGKASTDDTHDDGAQ